MNETVTLTIGKDETQILLELLVDFSDEPSVIVRDNADRFALSRLGGSLELNYRGSLTLNRAIEIHNCDPIISIRRTYRE